MRMQEEVGLQSATDGEFRRATWHMDFIYQIGGVSKAPGNLAVKFTNPSGTIEWTPAALHVGSKVRMDRTIFGEDFTYLKSQVSTAVPKQTIPSPNMVHYRGGPAMLDPEVYPDLEEFWADLAAAYADEVQRLSELGCTYLQFDDTSLAYLNDPAQRAEIAGRGEDAEHMHLRYIKQINDAVAGKPADMAITTHLCRGNFRSSWAASGGYDFVAEALFSDLNVDGFFLEYDDERSGGFEPLRFVPKGKMVVLGLVTTKRPELESKDELKRRIDEAAKFVPLDQICLSGQCGFSSTVEGNALTYDEVGGLDGEPDLGAGVEGQLGDRGGCDVDQGVRQAVEIEPDAVGQQGEPGDLRLPGVAGAAGLRGLGADHDGRRAHRHQHVTVLAMVGDHEGPAAGERHRGAVGPARVQVQADQLGHVVGAGLAGDQRRGALLDDAAAFEDDDLVGQHERLDRVVGDQQARPGEVGQVPLELGLHVQAGAGVEGRKRLVQEQQCRLPGQRAGQGHPLCLPAGQLAGLAVSEVGQPEPVEPVAGGRPGRLLSLAPGLR